MAGSRTLKLSILADVDQLRKNLNAGGQEVNSFADRATEFGKKAAAAFAVATAAAAAYATKLAVDGVKAAIEDEAAQRRLQTAIQSVTEASYDTIQATEEWITEQGLLKGFSDDQLRPALSRLVRSTKDVDEATRLASLAMDISVATGKSLETVTNALGKAVDGNVTSLGRLGLGFDQSEIKGKSLADLMPALTARFQGAAQEGADTLEGRLQRLQLAFSEAQETIGAYILQALQPLLDTIVNRVLPAMDTFARTVGRDLLNGIQSVASVTRDTLSPAFNGMRDAMSTTANILQSVFLPVWQQLPDAFARIRTALAPLYSDFDDLRYFMGLAADFVRNYVAPTFGTVLASNMNGVVSAVEFAINAFRRMIEPLETILGLARTGANRFGDFRDAITSLGQSTFDNLVNGLRGALNTIISLWNGIDFRISVSVPDWVPGIGGRSWSTPDLFPDIPFLAEGGIVTKPTLAMIGEAGPEAVIPLSKSNAMGGINITVNGAIDPESTARQIVQILNSSAYRGTLGAGALV